MGGVKFQKGNPGKPKGAVKKTTAISQEAIAAALQGSSEKIQIALQKLEGDAYLYIQCIAKLLPFVVPKKADITSNGQQIQHDLSNLTFEQLYELKYGRKPNK